MDRRQWMLGITVSAVLGLSACGSTYVISADVSSFGSWPEGRKPASYAFDRLPSQQQDTERQAALESAAAATRPLLKLGQQQARGGGGRRRIPSCRRGVCNRLSAGMPCVHWRFSS